MTNESYGYIVRLSQDQMERQLFLRRELFVGIRRDWTPGSKTIFVKRLERNKDDYNDQFIGSGLIQHFIDPNGLTEAEKQKCAENNWYGKI